MSYLCAGRFMLDLTLAVNLLANLWWVVDDESSYSQGAARRCCCHCEAAIMQLRQLQETHHHRSLPLHVRSISQARCLSFFFSLKKENLILTGQDPNLHHGSPIQFRETLQKNSWVEKIRVCRHWGAQYVLCVLGVFKCGVSRFNG